MNKVIEVCRILRGQIVL